MSEMPPELKQRCDDLAEKHMNEFFMKVGLPGPGSMHNQIFEAGFQACFEEMSKTHVPRADVQKLIEAIRASVARADDYGDSYCSQPIRETLKEFK